MYALGSRRLVQLTRPVTSACVTGRAVAVLCCAVRCGATQQVCGNPGPGTLVRKREARTGPARFGRGLPWAAAGRLARAGTDKPMWPLVSVWRLLFRTERLLIGWRRFHFYSCIPFWGRERPSDVSSCRLRKESKRAEGWWWEFGNPADGVRRAGATFGLPLFWPGRAGQGRPGQGNVVGLPTLV